MDAPAPAAKTAAGKVSAAAYLKAPPDLDPRWREITSVSDMASSYLHLLNRLSHRTDISELLVQSRSLPETLNLAFGQWIGDIYPKPLLQYFKPETAIYLHPDDPEEDNRRYLKITVSNAYINWDDFDISRETERAEELWPGTGISVLKALSDLPFRHFLWTPENIMFFVREHFWLGYDTEREFMEAENPDWQDQDPDDSPYPFSDKDLEYLVRWDKRTPASKTVHPAGEEIIQVCNWIMGNNMDSGAYGTTFPESILWSNEENVIGNILEEYELEKQEENTVLHAGGTQWDFSDVTKIDQNLDQIELYVREKEALTNAIINFKTRMELCLKKN
jgi:hypothetical protein